MITLIHGENKIKARERFNSLLDSYKEKGYETAELDPNKDIGVQLTNNSLFSNKIVYVVENVKKLASKIENKMDLIILCDKVAPATVTKFLPKDVKIEKFDIPKKLFFFLDQLYPKNAKNCLTMLHELSESEPLELVFAMVGRHIRDMYWVLVDEKSLGIPDWRIGKLKSQANRFTKENLKRIILLLSDIDYNSKSGMVDLPTSLDLLIASQLE